MKKLLLLLTATLLFAFSCTTNNDLSEEALVEEAIITANAKGCGPCGNQNKPCPPAKHYDWSLETVINYVGPDAPNIVIVGDGYSSTGGPQGINFLMAADDAAYAILNNSPNGGDAMPNSFNIYAYRVGGPAVMGVNADDGGAHPSTPADIAGWNQTTFNTYTNAMGIPRSMAMYHTNRFKLQQDLVGDGTLYWDQSTCSWTEGGLFQRKANGDLNVYVVCIA